MKVSSGKQLSLCECFLDLISTGLRKVNREACEDVSVAALYE